MTLFEYLAAAHTLILTFAVARLVSGASHAVRPGRFYWAHLSWLCMAIFLCLSSFWFFWSYQEVEWTYTKFIGALGTPVFTLAFASFVAPSEAPAVTSWRDYYFEVRVPMFATGVVLIGSAIYSNQAILGLPPMHDSQLGMYSLMSVFAIGLFSPKPRVHSALAFVPIVAIARIIATAQQPSSLTQ